MPYLEKQALGMVGLELQPERKKKVFKYRTQKKTKFDQLS